jgi:uncharacterized protein with HEPN domain
MGIDTRFSLFYVQEIRDNCQMILDRIKSYGITAGNYSTSVEYQDLLTMPTLRICEVVAKFKNDLSMLRKDYDWNAAAKMRSQIAHPYGGFDAGFVWDVSRSDIPELLAICNELLNA